jgi:three-Cys-motif partner protein
MIPMPFGGEWTQDKLQRVRKYLVAYAKIMQDKDFRFAYIDAFAGTGYQTIRREENPNLPLIPELLEDEPRGFLDGSARIALQVEPPFTKYIFIEKDTKRFSELAKLKEEFPAREKDIVLVNADANEYLTDLCRNRKWNKNRAVLFLDPFGMQVTWNTVKAVAETKAIDLWYLFPLGIGVNRLLKKSGKISSAWRRLLDATFGEPDWYQVFYKTYAEVDLLGETIKTVKVGDFDAISDYFVKRLKSIFPVVAENPLPLLNSRNNPLFLLCFASANKTAVKIAQDILRR